MDLTALCCEDPSQLQCDQALKQLTWKYQRDINCLRDPDRRVRKAALLKLKEAFLVPNSSYNETSTTLMELYFSNVLLQPLIDLLSDPVEKCREISSEFLMLLVRKSRDSPQFTEALVQSIIPAVSHRIGSLPFLESAEEIRLFLIKILQSLWEKESSRVWAGPDSSAISGLSSVLCFALSDSFPEVKRECCILLCSAIQVYPEAVRLYSESIMRSLVLNLGHQHAKTRQMTVEALSMLLLCGADDSHKIIDNTVIPQFEKLIFDRASAVRLELGRALARILGRLIVRDECALYLDKFHSNFLALLMMEFSDPLQDVSNEAVKLIDELGQIWVSSRSGDGSVFMDRTDQNDSMNPTALYCSYHLKEIMPANLHNIGHWTVKIRHRAVQLLLSVVEYVQNDVIIYLSEMIPVLCRAVCDDERDVILCAKKVGEALGHYIHPISAISDIFFPMLNGASSSKSSTNQFVQALVLLDAILVGLFRNEYACKSCEKQKEFIGGLCYAIGSDHFDSLENEMELLEARLNLCTTLLSSGAIEYAESGPIKSILTVLLQLKSASQSGFDLDKDAISCAFHNLAQAVGYATPQLLIAHYFEELIAHLLHLPAQECLANQKSNEVLISNAVCKWNRSTPERGMFEVLIQSAPSCVSLHVNLLTSIFRAALKPNMDPELRLGMILLLDHIFSLRHANQNRPFQSIECEIVLEWLLPNAVWQAGLVAGTIRKATIGCLCNIMQNQGLEESTVSYTFPFVFPVLITNLEDSDVKTRLLGCATFEHAFTVLQGSLKNDIIYKIYPELLKRLDDSNDEVRKGACRTLCAFFKSSLAENFRGTLLDFSVDQLLIHMDDKDKAIQESVYNVLTIAATIDPVLVQRKTKLVISSHRDTSLCNRLTRFSEELIIKSAINK